MSYSLNGLASFAKAVSHSRAMWKIASLILCLIILTSLSNNQLSAQQEEPERPNIAIIYDLSNSMWAKVNNIAKVSLAQHAIETALPAFENKVNLALLSFGHRSKTGCGDTEKISGLKPLRSKAIIAATKKLRPLGNAPIGKALLEAANLAENRAKPFSIILLTDGASKCPIDPCEAALSLKGALKDGQIEVIGIGKENDLSIEALSCISHPSAGLLTYANSPKDLSKALSDSINRAINFQTAKLAEQRQKLAAKEKAKDAWAGATEIEVDPIKDGNSKDGKDGSIDKFTNKLPETSKTHGGLALIAHLIDNGPAIKKGIVWRIYSDQPNKATQKHTLISAHRTAQPVMSLKAGNYLINAAYGRSYLTRKVTIKAGNNLTAHFILNAGGLRIKNVLANGHPVPENTVRCDVFSDERDQFGKRLKIIGNIRPGVVIRLNAGIYHIISTYGDANAKSVADISVEAGKLTEATLDHHAAKVTFKLVYQKGGEALAETTWSLLSPRGDLIKKSAGALPSHFLAAGNYTILAERGDQKYKQDFTVNAGENRQIEVIIR